MAVNLSPLGGVGAQFFDSNGNPLSGGLIYTYAAGTNTPQATYTSASGIIQHSNPIVLDAAGRVPTGEIWLTDGSAYKFVIQTSTAVLVGTYDNIVGINSNFVAYTSQQEIQTATAGQTVFTLGTMSYQPGTNNLSVFVDGVNQYGPGAMYAFVETDSTTVTFVSGLHVGASVKFTTATPVASAVINAENVAYDPPFFGSVTTNVEVKLSETVSPKDFGAVGDGVTDDKAAVKAALESGYIVDGAGLTYAIDGTCAPTSFVGLQNANFIQLSPTTANVATLELTDISNFYIDNVNFDMGSVTDTASDDSSHAALRIQASVVGNYVSNYKLTRISVTGDGNGSRFRIQQSKQFTIDNCSVYDCYAGWTPDPTNDIMNGFDIGDCSDFTLSNLVVKNLNVRISGVYVKGGRGILIAEGKDFNITNCNVTDVDQCYDFSGTVIPGTTPSYFVGNSRWTMSNCVSNNSGSWAFKFANVTKEGMVTGCVANNSGNAGFVISAAPLASVPNWALTQDIQFVGCRVNNVLGTGGAGTNSHGFRIMNTPAHTTYPRGIRFVGCHVSDTQNTPTTAEAYIVDGTDVVVYPAAGYDNSISNTITNCTASETVGTFSSNLSPNFCSITGTTTQSIPNNTWTNVTWDYNFYDYQGLHSTTSDNEAVNIKMAGWYRIDAKVYFAANATGSRGIRITKEFAEIDRSRTINAPSATVSTSVSTSFVTFFNRSQRVRIEVFQDSGGALNIDKTQSSMILTKIDG